MSRRESIAALLALVLCVACCPVTRAQAVAHTYALLAGVSEYPSLEPGLQLNGGPRNDVLLFKRYLLGRGVMSDNITVLTDGTPDAELPTRAAILENLSRLAERASAGDFVVLVFAGHGSQQPTKDDPRIEPDGLDEIFLPRDVGHWVGETAAVENAITDNEFGAALDRIRARGAFVWAIFDTCHSATMTRGMSAPEERDREVTPVQLGIPAKAMDAARRRAASAGVGEMPVELRQTAAPGYGGYVVFYSAQREESAPQRLLPNDSWQRELHGLFTFTLVKSLLTQPGATYRQIMERVLQYYQGFGIDRTTPGYEGTALDAPVLGVTNRTAAVQWPLSNHDGRLVVAAGELQQVTPNSILAVVPDPTSTDAALLGYVRVVRSGLAAAEVTPVEYAGRAAFKPDSKLVAAYTRPVDLKVDFTLRVGLPEKGKLCSAPGRAVRDAIAAIRADAQVAARFDWVAGDGVADVRLCQKSGRLVFLDGAGKVDPGHEASGLSLSSDVRSPLASELVQSLERVARVVNLYRVATVLPGNDPGVKVVLDYCPHAHKSGFENCHPAAPDARHVFHSGDGIRVELTNTSLRDVDVTILHVDASYAITALFPDKYEDWHPRLPGRSKPLSLQVELNAKPAGFERLLVIAVPMIPGREETSFVTLAQEGLPAHATRSAESGSLAQLLDDAAFGGTTRGSLGKTDLTAAISSFTWTVSP